MAFGAPYTAGWVEQVTYTTHDLSSIPAIGESILMARHTARVVLCLLAVGITAVFTACASSTGGAIPVEQYKEAADPGTGEYIISVGDMLSIQVFDQAQISGRMRVRSDGRISLAFVNDVQAAGKTPVALASELEAGLKSVVLNPKVTIVVEESKPLTISVLGEVSKPGTQTFERDSGVAQALAAAGGLTNFAHKNRIFVTRSTPKPVRIHFTYEALTRKVGPASAFRLQPGDVVFVE
jgi:polysaccharide export outer membrane protein